ncbi:UNVERIFIED_CONTAM: hypothetical protein K2H54_032133 [Gekko kuhli]
MGHSTDPLAPPCGAPKMATTHGNLQEFDINRPKQWETWLERQESYLNFHGVTKDGKKRALLVSACDIDI